MEFCFQGENTKLGFLLYNLQARLSSALTSEGFIPDKLADQFPDLSREDKKNYEKTIEKLVSFSVKMQAVYDGTGQSSLTYEEAISALESTHVIFSQLSGESERTNAIEIALRAFRNESAVFSKLEFRL